LLTMMQEIEETWHGAHRRVDLPKFLRQIRETNSSARSPILAMGEWFVADRTRRRPTHDFLFEIFCDGSYFGGCSFLEHAAIASAVCRAGS
jgi:hypothetical protein